MPYHVGDGQGRRALRRGRQEDRQQQAAASARVPTRTRSARIGIRCRRMCSTRTLLAEKKSRGALRIQETRCWVKIYNRKALDPRRGWVDTFAGGGRGFQAPHRRHPLSLLNAALRKGARPCCSKDSQGTLLDVRPRHVSLCPHRRIRPPVVHCRRFGYRPDPHHHGCWAILKAYIPPGSGRVRSQPSCFDQFGEYLSKNPAVRVPVSRRVDAGVCGWFGPRSSPAYGQPAVNRDHRPTS